MLQYCTVHYSTVIEKKKIIVKHNLPYLSKKRKTKVSMIVIRTPPHKGILWVKKGTTNNQQGDTAIIIHSANRITVTAATRSMFLSLFPPPARGEEVESDGTANHFLHV